MNRLLKRSLFLGLTSLLLSIALVNGCSDDIVLEPLPTLLGEYEGRYHYITGYGSTSQQTEVFMIVWRFSDLNYWMWNAADDDGNPEVCEPSGEYVLTGEVEIIEREAGCAGVVSSPDMNPTGVFALRQPGDSIVMVQIIEDICKEILLVPSGT
ncbi:MAG: hypothetical protein JSU74_02900 [Candidatus Zixiibacteriota bacterium]|nr:MAG: hypothetical protein JSU74_02900 [candidate division Zixibacteria bacterium]